MIDIREKPSLKSGMAGLDLATQKSLFITLFFTERSPIFILVYILVGGKESKDQGLYQRKDINPMRKAP